MKSTKPNYKTHWYTGTIDRQILGRTSWEPKLMLGHRKPQWSRSGPKAANAKITVSANKQTLNQTRAYMWWTIEIICITMASWTAVQKCFLGRFFFSHARQFYLSNVRTSASMWKIFTRVPHVSHEDVWEIFEEQSKKAPGWVLNFVQRIEWIFCVHRALWTVMARSDGEKFARCVTQTPPD